MTNRVYQFTDTPGQTFFAMKYGTNTGAVAVSEGSGSNAGLYSVTVDDAFDWALYATNTPANHGVAIGKLPKAESISVYGGGSVGDAGPGTTVRRFRVVDQAGKPIPASETWITSDITGQNQIAGVLFTNDQGYIEYRLNTGTYYFWRVHQDFTFTNPEPFTI